jgi:acetamidase/formamidase
MPKNLFPLDNTKSFTDQKHVGHNRWHPDIPPVVSVKPGEVFRADCREWFDGAIHNDDSADDVRNAPLAGVHVLSGPFRVEGAKPGDLLIVDILEIDACDQEDEGPYSGMGWGYTGVFATKNGGGFLTERFPDAYKVIWDFKGDVATSRHIPECSYVGIHHPGLMGTGTVGQAAREVDQARDRSDRHRADAGAAAGPAAAPGQRHPGNAQGQEVRQGGRRGGPHGSPARERREPGHQELHRRDAGLLPRLRRGGEPVLR